MKIKGWIFHAHYIDDTLNSYPSGYGTPIIINKRKRENAEKKFKEIAPFPFEYYQIIGFIQASNHEEFDYLVYWDEQRKVIYYP